jgi:hypothetical protein
MRLGIEILVLCLVVRYGVSLTTERQHALTEKGDERCTGQGGICQTTTCVDGDFIGGLCDGDSNRRCCVPSRIASIPDDPAEHTAIFYHGMNNCNRIKTRILNLPETRSDVLTPISPTNMGNSAGTGSPCHDWTRTEDPWPSSRPTPITRVLTVAGHSLGRNGLFRHIQLHGDSVQRAVLYDPSYENGIYAGKKGMQVMAEWLAGDSNRKFIYLYGGSTRSLCCGVPNFAEVFSAGGPNDALRAQILMRNVNIGHGQFPRIFNYCLFTDDGCGDPLP